LIFSVSFRLAASYHQLDTSVGHRLKKKGKKGEKRNPKIGGKRKGENEVARPAAMYCTIFDLARPAGKKKGKKKEKDLNLGKKEKKEGTRVPIPLLFQKVRIVTFWYLPGKRKRRGKREKKKESAVRSAIYQFLRAREGEGRKKRRREIKKREGGGRTKHLSERELLFC